MRAGVVCSMNNGTSNDFELSYVLSILLHTDIRGWLIVDVHELLFQADIYDNGEFYRF